MKILSFFSFSNLWKTLYEVFKRFNFPFVISVTVFLLFVVAIWFWENLSSDFLDKIFRINITLIVTFFFSTWLEIFLEQIKIDNIKKYLLRIIPLLFWWIFYYFFNLWDDFESAVLVWLTTTWFLAFLLVSWFLVDYFKWKYKENSYYNYFYEISVAFLLSFIFGWVLFLLWVIWIWAITTLFELDNILDVWKIIWYWAAFSLSFSAPVLGLNNLPKKESLEKEEKRENKFFSFLVKYIWIIFIYFYFFILYAYSVKLLINIWDWPNWEVAWMVIWFSIFGYLIYIFSYIFEWENNFIRFYRKYFPFAVIPQIFILFYAIYLRINQYDLTINRYFVVVFGIWLLVISVYYIFSKEKRLWFISLVLSIFVAVISIWPWWVYSLPESRQFTRLENNLTNAWILSQNWEIFPLKNWNDISKELSNNIYSWIDYLCDFDNCKKIKNLFSKELKEEETKREKEYYENINKQIKDLKNKWEEIPEYLERKYEWMSKWEITSYLSDYLKVYSSYSYENGQEKYFNINSNYNESFYPISLEDFDYLVNVYPFEEDYKENSNESIPTKEFSNRNERLFIEIDVDNKNLNLIKDKVVVESFSLEEINKKILEKRKEIWQDNFSPSDLTFLIVWEKYDIKIFFNNYSILNPEFVENKEEKENNRYYYKSVSWSALIKNK